MGDDGSAAGRDTLLPVPASSAGSNRLCASPAALRPFTASFAGSNPRPTPDASTVSLFFAGAQYRRFRVAAGTSCPFFVVVADFCPPAAVGVAPIFS